MVTRVGLRTAPGLAVNVAEVEPCGTVTDEGMLAPAGEEESVTRAPPLGAAAVRPTVQVEVLGGVIDTGRQERPFNAGLMVRTPPLPEIPKDAADPSAALRLVRFNTEELFGVDDATVTDTVATTPFPIAVVFRPYKMQVIAPEPLPQEIILLAAVAAAPAAMFTDEKSAGV